MNGELTALIDKLVTEKTFSVDGVKAIEQLRQKAAAQEEKIVRLEANARDLTARNAAVESERNQLRETAAAWTKREAELSAREAKAGEHEKKAAVAEAQAGAYMFALTTVFKPNSVREMVTKSVPIAQGNPSYVSTFGMSETITREDGV